MFAVLGSISFAIAGGTPTVVSESRWAGSAAVSDTTEGGNITSANISGIVLTDRWAAYYGNVSGSIILGSDTSNVIFTWAWTPASGGEVCLSTNSNFDFTTGPTSAAVADIDNAGAWNFGAVADNATNTFVNGTCANIVFSQSVAAAPIRALHESGSTFYTCAIDDGSVVPAKGDFAFCTLIQDGGTAFDATTVDYEIMVPTEYGAFATETYYFYVELD